MNTTRNFFVTNLFVLCTIVMLVSSGSIISAPNHTKFWTFESFLFKDFLFSISYHSEWLKPYKILFAEFFPGTQKFRTKMISPSWQNDLQTFYICIHIQNILLKVNVMSKLKHTSFRREYVSMKNEQRTYTCDVIPTIV